MRLSGEDVRRQWLAGLRRELERRREEHLFRELHEVESAQGPTLVIEGKEYIQFCTNNYLGLAADPEVMEAAREAVSRYGTGAGASRLVAGSMSLHHTLEAELARFKGTEAALVFPTGFMANLSVLTTFAVEGDLIVSDKLNHASLLDAAGIRGQQRGRFRIEGMRAEALLERQEKPEGKGKKFLVTDSVFSMDGDVADLPAVCDAAERGGALVMLDEAHATGVLGKRGAGVAELQGVEGRVAVMAGTLSKALGSVGGFVAGSREVVEMLINNGRSFIYTTALPPACCAAAMAALKIVEREPERRERVMKLAGHVKRKLMEMGFDCGDSASPIIPVILGDAQRAVAAAGKLREQGIYVAAIRPPTVPRGEARLRISLMATHTDEQVERLLETMRSLRQ